MTLPHFTCAWVKREQYLMADAQNANTFTFVRKFIAFEPKNYWWMDDQKLSGESKENILNIGFEVFGTLAKCKRSWILLFFFFGFWTFFNNVVERKLDDAMKCNELAQSCFIIDCLKFNKKSVDWFFVQKFGRNVQIRCILDGFTNFTDNFGWFH